MTVFHLAALRGCLEVVRLLLDAGADVIISRRSGYVEIAETLPAAGTIGSQISIAALATLIESIVKVST